MSMPALAHHHPQNSGARLVSLDGKVLPLRGVQLTTDAAGGIASVRVEQTFINSHAVPLHATYQLPLPADGAVVDFSFRIGDRRISGRIHKKADARAKFEDAILQGKTAALLEQDRSSLFTQEIGNIPAGATVVAEISVEQPLAWQRGQWVWRFPTVVAPRFLGAKTIDPERVSVDVADGPTGISASMSLSIRDVLTGLPHSTSHPIQASAGQIDLANAALDRDIVVQWPVAAAQPGVTVETARLEDGDALALITIVPPAAPKTSVPRDLILLLDTSGSMGGRPIDQAKAFGNALIDGLGPQDQLEMISFSSAPRRWESGAVAMDAHGKARAKNWLQAIRAGGGTWMHEAIEEALRPLRTDAQRQVILVTDGLIGFEERVIGAIYNSLPGGSRVHTVGVGSGVNRSLMTPAARAGGGVEVIVGLDESVANAVATLLARTDKPQLVDLKLSGTALLDSAPRRITDLFAGHPSRIAVRVRPEGGHIQLAAGTAEGTWTHAIAISPTAVSTGRRVIATRYAREKVEDLELAVAAGLPKAEQDTEIEALGLRYGISTRLTSWLAMTENTTVNAGDPTIRETVPQELPYGMTAEGVGLRSPAPAPVMAQSISFRGPARRRMKRRPSPAGGAPPPAPKAMAPLSMFDEEDAEMASVDMPIEAEVESKKSPARELVQRIIDTVTGALPKPEPAPEPEAHKEDKPTKRAKKKIVRRRARTPRTDPTRIKAVVKLNSYGKLVVEFTMPALENWKPESIEVELPNGDNFTSKTLPGTTTTGTIEAGRTVRLVVELRKGDPTPVTITIKGQWTLILELV